MSLTNDNKLLKTVKNAKINDIYLIFNTERSNMQTFKEFIDKNIGVSDEEWGLLESSMKVKHYKKGEEITFNDDIWTDIIYINSGLIRSYIITDTGKDFTRQLYFNTNESHTANLFVIDFTSILTQTPSNRGFEVLADSEVFVFSKENIYALYDAYKKWEHIGRIMAELAYMNMDTYYYGLLTKNATERYLHLKKTMSGLIDKTPQYHIASYLGITPVSLSRIKKALKEN